MKKYSSPKLDRLLQKGTKHTKWGHEIAHPMGSALSPNGALETKSPVTKVLGMDRK